ncbi:vWA domain-containing protein [Streptomyces sp. bgisy100]|uniref:vWA domain-containing protein n=1 Tax=Streptomyces sp. bgisy100 TaxID=3413783 RepID=UPI003D708785
MARPHRRTARGLLGGVVLAGALVSLPPAAAGATGATTATTAATAGNGRGSMVMVLDSSGSMADDDGSGRTRIAAARSAVGTVVDSLPDNYPTGLRVYGADKARGCDDTRLAQPVEPLDRAGIKRAVAAVKPKGDTPIGLSLRKAAADLPEHPAGAIGKRTILLVSDGEDNCQAPPSCEVAEELGRSGVDLRIDAIGFQVRGKARKQLECIAGAGNGRYYDAPDAKALTRQLQRAGQLSADGYRFKGRKVTGTPDTGGAPRLTPGQFLDTIGPNEKRYYAVELEGRSTAGFSATGVPQPGAAVDRTDALTVQVESGSGSVCMSETEMFGQNEGAAPITSGVSRVPSESGDGLCDGSGRYRLSVERRDAEGSDSARWPLELTFDVEKPLAKGVTPAQSQPDYGAAAEDGNLPDTAPKDVTGGTGFNDARAIGRGVWRDRILPSQTLWYKVPVGWNQQLRYDVEFANEPTVRGFGGRFSYGRTEVHTPARHPVGGGTTEFGQQEIYTGRPMALRMATVPVAWTNRYENHPNVIPVHHRGDFYIAVTLGAGAAEIAENPRIGVTLRVALLGKEKSGPQHRAPVVKAGAPGAAADTGDGGSGGWPSRPVIAAVAGGTGVALLAGLAVAYGRARRKNRTDPMRSGSW